MTAVTTAKRIESAFMLCCDKPPYLGPTLSFGSVRSALAPAASHGARIADVKTLVCRNKAD
jgi:hypothetical protein